MPPEPTYQPHVNKNLPDFDRLHAEFASDLDRVKRSREVTRVREFDITKSKKKPVVQEEPKQFRAKPYIPAPPPEDVPQPTKKTKDMIERNQARLKAREAKELAADLERRERLKQNPEMQSKLIPRIAATHAHGSATTDETIRALTRQARKGQGGRVRVRRGHAHRSVTIHVELTSLTLALFFPFCLSRPPFLFFQS